MSTTPTLDIDIQEIRADVKRIGALKRGDSITQEDYMILFSACKSLLNALETAKSEADALRSERVAILGELVLTVEHEERQRQKEVGAQEYRGNTVEYIYDKLALYYHRDPSPVNAVVVKARSEAVEECAKIIRRAGDYAFAESIKAENDGDIAFASGWGNRGNECINLLNEIRTLTLSPAPTNEQKDANDTHRS